MTVEDQVRSEENLDEQNERKDRGGSKFGALFFSAFRCVWISVLLRRLFECMKQMHERRRRLFEKQPGSAVLHDFFCEASLRGLVAVDWTSAAYGLVFPVGTSSESCERVVEELSALRTEIFASVGAAAEHPRHLFNGLGFAAQERGRLDFFFRGFS